MPAQKKQAHTVKGKGGELTPEQKRQRKQRVLTKGTPSVVSSIADAIAIKDEDIFFLACPDGSVPLDEGHGYGIYYHDCRYLNGYALRLADAAPNTLVSAAGRGYQSVFDLTNPDMRMPDNTLISKEQLNIKWVHIVDGNKLVLSDVITFENFSLEEYSFPVSLHFRAEFEDVFDIRGLLPEKLGKLHSPSWQDDALSFVYDGADGLYRSLSVYFSEKPSSTGKAEAHFDISLGPKESKQLLVSFQITETPDRDDITPRARQDLDHKKLQDSLQRSSHKWLHDGTQVESSSPLLNSIMGRSLLDLRVLRSNLEGQEYFAAGLPWFGTLFGRDSAVASLQMLAYQPQIAEQTLRLLAHYQGNKVDDYRDEQPGKILHSIRVGELARTGQIPHSPYYGSVDATPLFLILLGRHAAWTGDLGLFTDLRDNVERALQWMSKYGDTDGDGYIDYQSTSEKGLINQGWKDSGDAIVDENGDLVKPPIALVEVQGYAYMAKLGIADLYRRAGDDKRADEMTRDAEELRSRFNKDFWLDDKGFYALALQAGEKPCAVLTSNPGQAMWTGIVDEEKGAQTVKQLLSDDMYNGWGIRTLSDRARRYSPIAYHLGTVWPHDNSIITAGFRRYGADEEAVRVCSGIVEAATHFAHYRLPELFSGFSRSEYGVPVHYPVACHPQAWAAGSIPFMISTLLGLTPDGFNNRLRIVKPMLLDFVDYIEMRGLKVGKGSADLRFASAGRGRVEVEILKTEGGLEVSVER